MSEPHRLQFEREKTALKYFLLGKGFTACIKALGFIERYHTGLRKDGETPELHHQVRMCLTATHLPGIPDDVLQRLILALLLHDTPEDYQVGFDIINSEFGAQAEEDVQVLTKKFGKLVKDKGDYAHELALNPIGALAKGIDRNDNLDSMLNAFGVEKILSYTLEAEQVFLPMLKRASKLFPEYHAAFAVLTVQMKQKITFFKAYVLAKQEFTDFQSSHVASLISLKQAFVDQAVKVEFDIAQLTKRNAELEEKNRQLMQQEAALTEANERLQRACAEASCETKLKREFYNATVKIVQNLSSRLPFETKVSILRELAIKFGISTLELVEFNGQAISGDINLT